VQRTFSSTKRGLNFLKVQESFDFILDTIPYQTTCTGSFPLLKQTALSAVSGVGNSRLQTSTANDTVYQELPCWVKHWRHPKTQDMLDFCATQKIKPQQKIPMNGINGAWSKVVAKQARYRFVMDMNMKG